MLRLDKLRFYTNLTIGPLTSDPALEIGPGDGVIASRVQDGGEDCFRFGSNYRRSSWGPWIVPLELRGGESRVWT